MCHNTVTVCQAKYSNMMHTSCFQPHIWWRMTAGLPYVLTLWIIQRCLSHDMHSVHCTPICEFPRQQATRRRCICSKAVHPNSGCLDFDFEQKANLKTVWKNILNSTSVKHGLFCLQSGLGILYVLIPCSNNSISIFSVAKIAAQPWVRRRLPAASSKQESSSQISGEVRTAPLFAIHLLLKFGNDSSLSEQLILLNNEALGEVRQF